jgi:hypothetical protein
MGALKAGNRVKPNTDESALNNAARVAIAQVLGAERDARDAVERARLEVNGIAENARTAARMVAERTERRVRAVVDAFERELTQQLAAIGAEATQLDIAQPLTAEEMAALQRSVRALALELAGVRP